MEKRSLNQSMKKKSFHVTVASNLFRMYEPFNFHVLLVNNRKLFLRLKMQKVLNFIERSNKKLSVSSS